MKNPITFLLCFLALNVFAQPGFPEHNGPITLSGPLHVCIGSEHEYELIGYGAYTFDWHVAGSENNVEPEEPLLRSAIVYWGQTPGTYLINVYYGIDQVAQLEVTVHAVPIPVITTQSIQENCSGISEGYTTITSCLSNLLNLSVPNIEGHTYTWWVEPEEGAVIESGQDQAEVSLSFTQTGYYTLPVVRLDKNLKSHAYV